MMPISFADPHASYVEFADEINAAISGVLNSKRYVLGEQVSAFEAEFSSYLGAGYGVGCNSGTDALILSLKALGIGSGDEVITVPNTAIPTVSAIRAVGAMPVLVDVDVETYTMDPLLLPAAITKKTKAIIPVHLYGQPADMPAIMKITEELSIPVIEDCAQAHGAEIAGKKVGTFGQFGCFSFYPTKNLGCFGDGGLVVCNDLNTAERLKRLRFYGQTDRYKCDEEGINSRLDELHAAVLRVKLKYLDGWNEKRKKFAELYMQNLSNKIIVPKIQNNGKHVFHLFVIQCEKRDELKDFLQKKGIGTEVHYPIPLHQQPAWKNMFNKYFSVSEELSKRILSLPLFPQLSAEQVMNVCNSINQFY